MRFVYFIILIILVAPVVLFAVQNHEIISLQYIDQKVDCPLPLLIAAAYLLGMISGWTVVGLLKRSLQSVTENRQNF